MTRPRDRAGSPNEGLRGPIEPGSALHRLLTMVAEEIARSQARGFPTTADSPNAVQSSCIKQSANPDLTSLAHPPPPE